MGRPAGRGARSGTLRAWLAVAAVAGSYLAVRSGVADGLDHRTTELTSRPLGPLADRVVAAGTDLGSLYGLTGVSGVLAVTGQRRRAVDVAASGLMAWSASQAAKPALDRVRPYEADTAARLVAPPAGSSWPSGHVAVAAAMATTLRPWLTPSGRGVAGAATAAIAASRLYVGVHHLTDLVAGWGVGVLAARAWRTARSRWP